MKLLFALFGGFFFTVATAEPLRILTYESMLGKGSFGELLEQQFPKFCSGCELKFELAGGASGLPGKLRSSKRMNSEVRADVVMGLDPQQYESLRSDKLIESGEIFDLSPFVILIDTQKLPLGKIPKDIAQAARFLEAKMILPDPKLSAVGLGWLRFVFQMKALDSALAKKMVKRQFPSWSAAYKAFLDGEAPAIWTYLTSEAYHRCNDKENSNRYLALPLKESYPVGEEWLAPIPKKNPKPQVKKFMEFVGSAKIQNEVALKNWMFPAAKGTELPECFKNLSVVKSSSTSKFPQMAELQKWFDLWSLL